MGNETTRFNKEIDQEHFIVQLITLNLKAQVTLHVLTNNNSPLELLFLIQ